MGLERRVTAILSSAKPGAAPQVRTSEAFAARFQAEARRSGLVIDVAEKRPEQMFRLCPVCGAQNSSYADACYNCQTELGAAPPPAVEPRKPSLREDRWRLIMTSPKTSRLPLLKVPLVQARFAPPPAVAITGTQVLNRFLSVFVEREPGPSKSVARFDERTMFDKFLSVFVERK